MEKINSKRILSVVIVAIFCCSFLFFIPHTTRFANPLLISKKDPIVSTSNGSSNATGYEWPMFHYSLNHTGSVTETSPVGNKSSIWTYHTSDPIYSSPAIVNGCAYIGGLDHYLYCVYTNNGSLKWKSATGGTIDSSPAVANGMVYVGSEDDYIYCFYATNGTQVWSQPTNNYIMSSPAVANGMVYIGSADHNLYCFNATNGTQIWSQSTLSIIYSSPAVVNGMVYIGSSDSNLYCFNALTGALIWSYSTAAEIFSSPAVANGLLYIGDESGNMYCINASTKTQIWESSTGGEVTSSPAVANGMVYVGNHNGNVYCFNATNGTQIWSYPTGNTIYSSPAVANGMVYIGSTNGNLYCLNASTGTYIWSYNNGAEYSCPAIVNGMVYVGSYTDNNIYCLPMILYHLPSAPLNLAATRGNGQVTLSWNVPSDDGCLPITEYNIYRSNLSGSETFLTYMSATTTQYTDTGLTSGQKYYYKVSAINAVGEGSQSNEANATPSGVPSMPQNLQIYPGNNIITLKWQVPLNNGNLTITDYNVYRGNTSGTETLLTTVDGNTLIYSDISIATEHTYYYKVSANNSDGEGLQSNEVNGASIKVPSVPLNFQATPGNNSVKLTWQVPSDNGGSSIIGYKIYRGDSLGTVEFLTTISADTFAYIDTGLTSNTTYYYEISAMNLAGAGQKSSEIHVTTLASNSTNSTNSPNNSKHNSIGGMGIVSLLLISSVGVITVVVSVKKRMKQ